MGTLVIAQVWEALDLPTVPVSLARGLVLLTKIWGWAVRDGEQPDGCRPTSSKERPVIAI